MKNVQGLRQLLDTPRKVVILTHHKPDADALGSSLGLAGYLERKGHPVQVITPSDYPNFLAWMPGNEKVFVFEKEKLKHAARIIEQAEVIFCLDFSSLSRIYELGDMVRASTAVKVLVDHHLEPEKFAHYEQWDTTAASTAELVFQLIDELGDKNVIDAPIANCLYAGVMTDTGGFRHSNTNHKVFLVASELVSMGANPSQVSKLIYDTNSIERLRLTGYVLNEKLTVLPEYATTYIVLTAEELKRFGSQTGDTEGLVNYGLSIKGISMAALMYERKDDVKLSFRSIGNFSVNDFARSHFEGGGHKNASGGQSKLSIHDTLKKFLELLPQYKNQLLNP
jgi:phosphoesterase RecJ-like protein